MPVPSPQFRRDFLVPFKRGRTEIKPGVHADTEKHIHLQPIGFGQDRFEWILGSNLCPTGEQLGWIVRQPLVAGSEYRIPTIIFLVAKTLLNHNRIHSDAVHTVNLLAPIGFG